MDENAYFNAYTMKYIRFIKPSRYGYRFHRTIAMARKKASPCRQR